MGREREKKKEPHKNRGIKLNAKQVTSKKLPQEDLLTRGATHARNISMHGAAGEAVCSRFAEIEEGGAGPG